jgi:hypothetical protein
MSIETRVREALAATADEVGVVSLLDRLDAGRAGTSGRMPVRRWSLTLTAAAAVVLALAAGAVLAARMRGPSVLQPVDRPPKLLRVSGTESLRPGTADLAVVVASTGGEGPRAYLWPRGKQFAVALPESTGLPWGAAWTQQMSLDGSTVVRQKWYDNRLEVVDLRTGQIDEVGGLAGYCPAIAPDNGTVALIEPQGRAAVLVDLGGHARWEVGTTAHDVFTDESDCSDDTFAWSPTGDRLAVLAGHDSTVVDRQGRVQTVLPGLHATNSSMSWSPDGRRLLLYQRLPGRFAVMTLADRTVEPLVAPPDADRPMGWAGDRVVWLVGGTGEQRLVVSRPDGRDAELWTRLDVGDTPVRTVQWSVRLTGTAG